MTTSSTPTWRQVYNEWETAVAPALQQLTASAGFKDLIAVAVRVNANMAEEAERLSRQWLHAFNLPAASDVSKLRHQIASLEQEVKVTKRLVKQQLDESPAAEEPTVLNLVHRSNAG